MSTDLLNANPTVLDASSLPKRNGKCGDSSFFKKRLLFSKLATDKDLPSIMNENRHYTSFVNLPIIDTKINENDENNEINNNDPLYLDALNDLNYNSNFSDLISKEGKTFKENKHNKAVSESDNDFELIDSQEIYDLIASISDPEHPVTLGQLSVVNLDDIKVVNPVLASEDDDNDENSIYPKYKSLGTVTVFITPTVTHCSLATLIGLCIRVRLERSLPPMYRLDVVIKEGTHQSQGQVNRQLNDKERAAAACENEQLLGVITNMMKTCE